MKAAPLLVSWHNDNSPIYSCHFEPHGKGRLATAGGDNNVRLWKIDATGEERKVTYLSTLIKHTQAVNVVRWCPRGELLGSAGDDGNVLLWVPSENPSHTAFGEDHSEDKEIWRVKHMCRSFGSEIYDLAWSPDGTFFITGSMDNVARIYNASTGQTIRQIAEHSHYVQGVAWDPLNEFVATQSSDRSVHIYTLKTKDGQFSLAQHNKITKMDLPARRISSNSPAPPDFGGRAQFVADSTPVAIGSPIPSAPGTPASLAMPMNPPPTSHSRRSSFGTAHSSRRSVSPSPSLPLPAVMPSASPSAHSNYHPGLGVRNTNLYANETFTSFFRRLTFAPDGSLLFTPSGQYKFSHPTIPETGKLPDDIINTVYIYTRAGLNKPPIAYLPGHKKPSIAVKCSPIYYTLRQGAAPPTRNITVDTSSAEDEIPALPEPILPSKPITSHSSMDPPPFTSAPSPSPSMTAASPKPSEPESATSSSTPALPAGPPAAFGLPYRLIYAVATQDAVIVYDTQQTKPLAVVSNLHFATFTDLSWSCDGLTLLMTSSDGFCSCLTFASGELGQVYQGPFPAKQSAPVPPTSNTISTSAATNTNTATSSQHTTPTPTPTSTTMPSQPFAKQPVGLTASSPSNSSAFTPNAMRPASPARSMSNASISSMSSFAQYPASAAESVNAPGGVLLNNATPSLGAMPSVAAAQSGPVPGNVPLWTPPETPAPHAPGSGSGGNRHGRTLSTSSSVSGIGPAGFVRKDEPLPSVESADAKKREAESATEEGPSKKRRIAPTLVSVDEGGKDDGKAA